MTKNDMRKAALKRRDATDPLWRVEVAAALAGHASDLGIEAGTIVSGFFPIRSEVDIRPLMFQLRADGCRLALPVVLDRETIVFRELIRGAPMVDTGFGTVGPDESAAVLDPAVLLMPLAAFDDEGNRLGYGAGHYDRAIARLHAKGLTPRLIGVAFSCQREVAIPTETHDVPLDAVLTEEGLHRFNRGAE